MTSRVHPKEKTKDHVGNWPADDRALVQRGDVTLWLAPEAITPWAAAGVGQRGGPLQDSDLAIATARTLRLIFPLSLRQTEGFLTSIFWRLDLDLSAPDHTPRSRRGQHLVPTVRRAPAGAGTPLIVDSTGLSIVGDGEWAAVKHGGRGRRGWKTRHLGVDGSGVIIAHALTDANVEDATTGTDLIEAVVGDIARVTADAAYATIAVYESAGARDAPGRGSASHDSHRVAPGAAVERARSHDQEGQGDRTPSVEERVCLPSAGPRVGESCGPKFIHATTPLRPAAAMRPASPDVAQTPQSFQRRLVDLVAT